MKICKSGTNITLYNSACGYIRKALFLMK